MHSCTFLWHTSFLRAFLRKLSPACVFFSAFCGPLPSLAFSILMPTNDFSSCAFSSSTFLRVLWGLFLSPQRSLFSCVLFSLLWQYSSSALLRASPLSRPFFVCFLMRPLPLMRERFSSILPIFASPKSKGDQWGQVRQHQLGKGEWTAELRLWVLARWLFN